MTSIEKSSNCCYRIEPLKAGIVCAALLVTFCAMHFSDTDRTHEFPYSPNMQLRPSIASRERMLEITRKNLSLLYLPTSDILLAVIAKAGTTSTFQWLYLGTVGQEFNIKECQSWVQSPGSRCWRQELIRLYDLPQDEQWRILTSKETLRVAIQRDPMSRLISAYKSKFACYEPHLHTDTTDRAKLVPEFRRQAGFPEGPSCMNISEFASALDSVRRNVGTQGHALSSLQEMDVHIRPQQFYFDEIDYDIVLNTKDLNHKEYLQPIIDRLKFRYLVKGGIGQTHVSEGRIMMSEEDAELLHLFALESKTGERKLLAGRFPEKYELAD